MERNSALRAVIVALAAVGLVAGCGPDDLDPGTRDAVDAVASAGAEVDLGGGGGTIDLVITGDLPRTEWTGGITDTYGEHCRLGRTPPFEGGSGADVVKSKAASGERPAVALNVWSPRQAEAGELQGPPQVIVEVNLDTAFTAPLPAGAVNGATLRLDLALAGVNAYAGKTAHVAGTVTCAAGSPTRPAAAGTPGSASPTDGPAGRVDVCGLISTAQMAELAGVEVTGTEFEMRGDVSNCAYVTVHHGFINVQYQPGGRTHIDSPLFSGGEKVPGLGEDAKWFEGRAGLHVAVGGQDTLNVMLGASGVKLRGGDLKGLAIDIAEAALPRLRR
ncbi:hypothetical protein [Micromonospora sp. NPDC048830]|uniref:hypothetical protein n=1 Tax=Micromonospora sp. NPDC048830 TaxID=3364257 RepID=UPI0037192C67